MLTVLRQRNFGLLWIAGLVSLLGDWILFAALPFYIYERTGSPLATGAMFVASTVPRVLFGSLAGVFVDRWDRKQTMIISDLSRALLLLVLLGVRSPEWFWLIYFIAFVETTISLFFGPAKGALIPHLVNKQQLVRANSLNGLSDNFSRLVGPALGGALLGFLGLSGVVLVDSFSYLLSAALITCIVVSSLKDEESALDQEAPPAIAATWVKIWQEWLSGLRVLWRERWISILLIVMGMAMVAQGIINVLLVVFVKEVMGGDAQTFGWLVSAQGIGGLIGGLIIGQIGASISPARLLGLSLTLVAIIFFAVVNVPVFMLALGLLIVLGIPVMGWMISASTLLQDGVPDAYRGRVYGAFGTTQAVLMLVGMGLASGFGNSLGVVIFLNIASGLLLLAGIGALSLLNRAVFQQKLAVQRQSRLISDNVSS